MNSEAPGARGRTGHSIRQRVDHCRLILTCTRCGRHFGATTLKSFYRQIPAQLFRLPGELRFLPRNLQEKTSSFMSWKSVTKVIPARRKLNWLMARIWWEP